MQSPQAKLKQIRRILALWPSQAGDDGEDLLRGYLLAVDDYPADDVERGVDQLVKGTAPGINPSFRPKPSEVGAECRRQLNLRLDAVAREKLYRPALPKPDYVRSPDEEARVKAGFDELIASLSVSVRTEDAAATARNKAMLDKANRYFAPDMSEEAIHARLGRRRYSVGDPHEDAA
jgi:hypothetical protein